MLCKKQNLKKQLMKVVSKQMHPKLVDALTKMMVAQGEELQFYAFYLSYVQFYEVAEMPMPTMCVTVRDMRLALFWDRGFVEERTVDELIVTLLHEVLHLLHSHLERGKSFNPKKANVAMDMIINSLIAEHHKSISIPRLTQSKIDAMKAETLEKYPERAAEIEQRTKELKSRVGEPEWITLDPKYSGDRIFEPLYQWLTEQQEKEEKQEGSSDMSQATKDAMKWAEEGMTVDYHGELDEVSQDIKDQLAEGTIQKAKIQMRGSLPGNLEEMFNFLLKKPKDNNIKILRRKISNLKGSNKEKSYRRLNRRVPGIKGKVKQSLEINVLLDTSGSMYGRFELALGEIFRDGYKVNLVQVDTDVRKVEVVKRKEDLKNLMIEGMGGTTLSPAIAYVNDPKNKLKRNPTVILTDGYTDVLDFQGAMNQYLILSTDVECPTTNIGANVKQIIIK